MQPILLVTNATLSLDARSRESIYFALVSSSTQHRTEKMVCEWSSAVRCHSVGGFNPVSGGKRESVVSTWDFASECGVNVFCTFLCDLDPVWLCMQYFVSATLSFW